MTHPLSFRKHVLQVQRAESLTFRETAKRFKIGVASLIRWHNKLEPSTRLREAYKINMEALKADVAERPDDFLHERAARFGVTANGIHRALKRLKITYKKNTATSKSGRKGTYGVSRKN